MCTRHDDLPATCPVKGNVETFNRRLLDALHRDGRVFLGPVRVDGELRLRGRAVNLHSSTEDAKRCVEVVSELGQRLDQSWNAGTED